MEKTSTNPGWPQIEAVEPIRDIDRLRLAIADMRSIAVHSSDQIVAIGSLALLALEAPMKTEAERENLAQAILTMIEKAEITGESLNYEADRVGVVYSDGARSRRAAAHHA